jgi:inner membrane transporter RhtA
VGIAGTRLGAAVGVVLVVVSCLAIESSAAFSARVDDALAPPRIAGLRQLVGAVVLLVLVRPRVRGRSRRAWGAIVGFGLTMALMNVAFYSAVELLPLGVAATLIYLGPFAVAAVHTPRGPQLALPVVALLGVALVSRPGGAVSATGLAVGLVSAVALGTYTLASRHVGRITDGLDGLALAVGVSGLSLTPLSLPALDEVPAGSWDLVLWMGLAGVALAFACDLAALRLLEARVVATLFALDPVVGALLGAVLLGQALGTVGVAGILLVAGAGAAVTALSSRGTVAAAAP